MIPAYPFAAKCNGVRLLPSATGFASKSRGCLGTLQATEVFAPLKQYLLLQLCVGKCGSALTHRQMLSEES